MIAVADYGIGNLGSIAKGLRHVGADVRLATSASELDSADAIVVPGDGAFGATVRELRARGFDQAIRRASMSGKPVIGICVGMQVFFESSEEQGQHQGLGLLPGHVRRLPTSVLLPHMGWNALRFTRDTPLSEGLGADPHVYFVHSYYCDAEVSDTIACSTHGASFPAVVGRGSLFGIQFHPEKSQVTGLRFLANLLRSLP